MNEIIEISNGKGNIHIKGNAMESYLYIKKKPKIAIFFVNYNTILRYQISTEITQEILQENYIYENIVSNGILQKKLSLSEQFSHLTQLLTNGLYLLSYEKSEFQVQITSISPFEGSYGRTVCFSATQSYINSAFVEHYKKKIKAGIYPIPVLLKIKDSNTQYILDGHHKLKAYQDLKIKPYTLTINKLQSDDIETHKGIEIMNLIDYNNTQKIIDVYTKQKSQKIDFS
ncbi:hypothetical protein AD998_06350 [bacterium 336/3]|nr:hypothetical protein AD998_06350 [bacterium 336/3]